MDPVWRWALGRVCGGAVVCTGAALKSSHVHGGWGAGNHAHGCSPCLSAGGAGDLHAHIAGVRLEVFLVLLALVLALSGYRGRTVLSTRQHVQAPSWVLTFRNVFMFSH